MKDLTRSYTHETDIQTTRPELPKSTAKNSQVLAEYNDFLERKHTEMSDQLYALKQVLNPAIEAAEKQLSEWNDCMNKKEESIFKALLEAGRILGIEDTKDDKLRATAEVLRL